MNIFKSSNFVSRSLIGAVGLSASAVSLFGVVESAKAANFTGSFSTSGVPVHTAVFDKYDPNGDEIPTGTFMTEMEAIDFSIDVPDLGSVMVREDPNKTSTGETTVTEREDGDYQIESFFDIFSQISLDGGMTWFDSVDEDGNAAPMRVELAEVPNPTPDQFGCITSSFLLPPDCGGYWSQFHSWFEILNPLTGKRVATIHLSDVFHFGFGNIGRIGFPNDIPGPGFGPHQNEWFDSEVTGNIEVTMVVPEPSMVLASIFGLGGMLGLKRKKESDS
ncbi:MAG: PEP-CTERM sorting domain-containing protein [Cyanobacteriota bacterium]|nr:PEP-CTERM sorting domain-containing protein [Cyanobacteriota bacterium]